jgi:hypothetical protein
MRTTPETLTSLILSLLLIATGLCFGAVTLRFFYKNFKVWQAAQKSKAWPATPGYITKAELFWVRGGRSAHPKPVIEYTYPINGVPYTGNRIAFEYAHVYSREEVEAILQRFPVGSQPLVYYDPDELQDSTLEPKHRGLTLGLFVNLILLFSPTTFCLCVGILGLVETLNK